eukprot:CAMPEP_0201573294 /NCGR_PEP_ID=MMETSP0190_2-20130828/17056_1 /ASSEMBLY_ACC=CAM_ASM_000263 /TAXON_ID=37353 /ORGANISM="Rosalina sp." /LENGTH=72 /DNA_ID=CAMNT_0048000069 /DNA_START=201 /DNA_END=419 /DNA_ORIENTATION=+
MSVQYGSEDGSRFKEDGNIISDNYQFREAATENPDEVGDEECADDTDTDIIDNASTISIFATLIIGFIAMLF